MRMQLLSSVQGRLADISDGPPTLPSSDLAVELLAPSPPVQMRFLPSTPLRTVLLKISKHLSLSPAQRARVRLVRVPSGDGGEEELEGSKCTLQDLGVEQGDSLRVILDDV